MTGIFFAWANDTYCSMETISSNDLVEVETGDYIVYKPIEKEVSKGFIFYPWAKVEPDAYSKLCSKIAEEGYLVVIAPMTLDLAILSPNKAEDIIKFLCILSTRWWITRFWFKSIKYVWKQWWCS